MDEHNCFNCRFFLSFTPAEAKSFRDKLAKQGLYGDFLGGCTYKSPNRPLVIRRYLNQPINGCVYWEQGYFQDPVGMSCPQCKEGQLVIVRPVKDKKTYTMIGCSRYPNCSFKTKYLPLETLCRFCEVPLVLGASDQLVCYCPQCKRSAIVPLTVASWPHLFKVGDTCPHGHAWGKCETCNRSRAEKHNVVDLELPGVARHWLQKRKEQKDARDFFKDEARRLARLEADYRALERSPEQEFVEQEFTQELLSELDEFSERWARAHGEGWFYED